MGDAFSFISNSIARLVTSRRRHNLVPKLIQLSGKSRNVLKPIQTLSSFNRNISNLVKTTRPSTFTVNCWIRSTPSLKTSLLLSHLVDSKIQVNSYTIAYLINKSNYINEKIHIYNHAPCLHSLGMIMSCMQRSSESCLDILNEAVSIHNITPNYYILSMIPKTSTSNVKIIQDSISLINNPLYELEITSSKQLECFLDILYSLKNYDRVVSLFTLNSHVEYSALCFDLLIASLIESGSDLIDIYYNKIKTLNIIPLKSTFTRIIEYKINNTNDILIESIQEFITEMNIHYSTPDETASKVVSKFPSLIHSFPKYLDSSIENLLYIDRNLTSAVSHIYKIGLDNINTYSLNILLFELLDSSVINSAKKLFIDMNRDDTSIILMSLFQSRHKLDLITYLNDDEALDAVRIQSLSIFECVEFLKKSNSQIAVLAMVFKCWQFGIPNLVLDYIHLVDICNLEYMDIIELLPILAGVGQYDVMIKCLDKISNDGLKIPDELAGALVKESNRKDVAEKVRGNDTWEQLFKFSN